MSDRDGVNDDLYIEFDLDTQTVFISDKHPDDRDGAKRQQGATDDPRMQTLARMLTKKFQRDGKVPDDVPALVDEYLKRIDNMNLSAHLLGLYKGK